MKQIKKLAVLFMTVFMVSCVSDNYDEHLRTFQDETIASWLEKNSDRFSKFTELLRRTQVLDLMAAYGTYTIFVPSNEAVDAYFAELGITPEELPEDELFDLVYNHIMKVTLKSIDFPMGTTPDATLGGHYLNFTYDNNSESHSINVNTYSRLLSIDEEVHNGVIHTVDGMIRVSRIFLAEVIATDPRCSLFGEALYATHLNDSMMMTDDKNYETGSEQSRKRNETASMSYPEYLKRGYTAFVETDSVFNAAGIYTLDDLKAYAAKIYDRMYPGDSNVSDPTQRNNSLNRFVAYHIMDRIQSSNEFLTEDMDYHYVPGSPRYAYMEMMAPNTLLEILDATYINRMRNGSSIQFVTTNHEAINGLYHTIDGILAYSYDVENDVLNKRIRIDFASMIPEMLSNKLRTTWRWIILPHGYCSKISMSEDTQLQYIWGPHNYEWDEVLPCGRYDITVRIPPIPAGAYEIRYGYSPYVERGVAQLYFDGKPCGIPLDCSLYADNPKIGWVKDSDTDDDGVENDKMMRNRGYMKGPTVIWTNSKTTIARDDNWYLRKILKTETFDRTEPHTIRIKCVEEADKEFHLDFIEFMPTSMLYNETRD
jgi:uncharacterized surface protein with fasciclin (FAS1) repeats